MQRHMCDDRHGATSRFCVYTGVHGAMCRECVCVQVYMKSHAKDCRYANVHGVTCRNCVNAGVNKLCIAMSLGLPGVCARCRHLERTLVLLTLTDACP